MKSFPRIKRSELQSCFDNFAELFSSDKSKILDAAIRATADNQKPIVLGSADIDDQITVIRERIGRTADSDGQSLLILWIEELYDDFAKNKAIGVTEKEFIRLVSFSQYDGSVITYQSDKKWIWQWELKLLDETEFIKFNIRGKDLPHIDVVPGYILQYIEHSIAAYKNTRPAAALALMSIALEGTLRDALEKKGYTYSHGESSEDNFKLKSVQVFRNTNGFEIVFPEAMPKHYSAFLEAPDARNMIEAKIKRVKKWDKFYLEIRKVDDIIDFWSSDEVETKGKVKISGLGAAISIGRGIANIIDSTILPPDTDKVIQAVRNNLIHLSGSALQTEVIPAWNGKPAITLEEYISNDNRVFDLLYSMTQTINRLYNKISEGIFDS